MDELFDVSTTRQPTGEEVAACCASIGGDTESALNMIALALAERYDSGSIDFAAGDLVANALHCWYFQTANRLLPDPANQVFLAFDEGEYHHRSDAASVDPEAEYTRPMIKTVLRGRNVV